MIVKNNVKIAGTYNFIKIILRKSILPRRSIFLIIVVGIISSFLLTSQNIPASNLFKIEPKGDSLNILSWNIFMLPRILKNGQIKRAYAIVDQLKDKLYDIIVFQEAIDIKVRRILLNGLKENFPYQYGPGKGGLFRLNSGVWIISKLPLKNGKIIKFHSCKTYDCIAKKGAVFVEVDKNGQKFQIIGTHCQSQAGEKYQLVRKSQYEKISEELLKPLAEENVPQFVVGDLNTAKKNTSSYNEMLRIMNVQDGVIQGNILFSCNGPDNHFTADKKDQTPKLIDYILIKPNGNQPKIFIKKVKIFQQLWNEKNKDLSDHYAVEAIIVF